MAASPSGRRSAQYRGRRRGHSILARRTHHVSDTRLEKSAGRLPRHDMHFDPLGSVVERSASDRLDNRYSLQLRASGHRSVGALSLLRIGPSRQHRADRHLAHRTQQRGSRPRKSRHGDKHAGKRDVSGDAHRQPYVFFVRRTPRHGWTRPVHGASAAFRGVERTQHGSAAQLRSR